MPTSGETGYSLIEILVSLALFSVAALGLAAAAVTTLQAGKISADFTRATILAQDKLEELCGQSLSLGSGADTPEPGFTRTWSIIPDSPEVGVIQVDVAVSWTAPQPRTVVLATVVND
jgi:prepilin-type N-terminal cleavage/methylation domain-containing protein